MNRAERRRRTREGRRCRRKWLAGVESSSLPDDAKRIARELARVADDEGRFSIDDDALEVRRGWPA